MQRNHNNSREAKARVLLESNSVQLFIGQGYALVTGSRGTTYRITKAGCECPGAVSRQRDCYHTLAVKQLCAEYHRLKLAAEFGERVRPSTALIQAIRWPETPKGTCRECGRPTSQGLCADCFIGVAA